MNSVTILGFAGTTLAGFFAIMNPIANTAIFISLTADDDKKTQKTIARNSLSIAFAIVAAVSIAGSLIFNLFDITLPTLRIVGGILLFIIGYHMLQGAGSRTHTPSESDLKESLDAELQVAVSPLAIPILAGPGTIAAAMSFSLNTTWTHIGISLLSFAIICIVTYFCFINANKIVKYMGKNGLNVATRLMGLIVATIGTGMLIQGLTADISEFLETIAK